MNTLTEQAVRDDYALHHTSAPTPRRLAAWRRHMEEKAELMERATNNPKVIDLTRIKEWREARGFTHFKLGKLSGINQFDLKMIEEGRKGCTIDTYNAIVKWL